VWLASKPNIRRSECFFLPFAWATRVFRFASSGERGWTIYVTFTWSGKWLSANCTVYRPRRSQSELLPQYSFYIPPLTRRRTVRGMFAYQDKATYLPLSLGVTALGLLHDLHQTVTTAWLIRKHDSHFLTALAPVIGKYCSPKHVVAEWVSTILRRRNLTSSLLVTFGGVIVRKADVVNISTFIFFWFSLSSIGL
jgi:hypothetical protein